MAKRDETGLPKGVDRLPSGNYRLRRTIKGQKYVDVDADLSALMQRFEQKKAEFLAGRRASLDSWTVETFFCEWMSKFVEDAVKISTVRNRESIFYSHVCPVFGKRYIDEISPFELNEFLKKMANSGLKDKTINNMRSLLNCMFEAAVSMKVISNNPLVSVKTKDDNADDYLLTEVPHIPEVANQAIELEEVASILQIMSSSEYYNYLRFAMLTGLRGGECAALRESRVIDNKIVIDATISRLYSKKYDVICFNLRTVKSSAGNRVLIITDLAREIIEEQIRANRKNKIKYAWEPCEILVGDKETTAVMTSVDDFIFRKEKTGAPYMLPTIDAVLKYAINKYNKTHEENPLPVISTHNLRHTFATLAKANKVEPEILQRVLGHSNFETTNKTYINIKPEVLHEAVKGVMQDIADKCES